MPSVDLDSIFGALVAAVTEGSGALDLGSGSGSGSVVEVEPYTGSGLSYEFDEGAIFGVLVALVSVVFLLIFANAMFDCGPFKSAPAVESAEAGAEVSAV